MYVHTDAEKFLEIYETIWTKIECFIKLNHSSIYADRYVKTKLRINGDKFYTNFRDLNVPEDDIEYESFIAILFIIYWSSKANSRYIFFSYDFFDPKCLDAHKPKSVNNPRSKCGDYFCK